MAFVSPTMFTPRLRFLARNRTKKLLLVLGLLCFAVIVTLAWKSLAADAGQSIQTTASITAPKILATAATLPPTAAATSPAAPNPNSNPAATVMAPPACVPTSLNSPGLLNLATAPTGLTQVVDTATLYRIYGNTATQVRQQLQNCAPRSGNSSITAEFTGQTMYQASWSYDVSSRGDGSCSVGSAKIGMHVGVILPTWQASSSTTEGLDSRMQSFLNGLATHEQGHVQIDQQYAAQMLSDLQNFPASSCDTIQTSVKAVLQQDISALNVANESYDTSTNHGATQGAVLPN